MKRIDWVLENKQEEIRELIISELCPYDFGLSDRDINSCGKDCNECWNEEMEVEE